MQVYFGVYKVPACTWENKPKGVCSVRITWPLPPQVEHILILEPTFDPVPMHKSQVSKWDNSISFSAPKIASENFKIMSYLKKQFNVNFQLYEQAIIKIRFCFYFMHTRYMRKGGKMLELTISNTKWHRMIQHISCNTRSKIMLIEDI